MELSSLITIDVDDQYPGFCGADCPYRHFYKGQETILCKLFSTETGHGTRGLRQGKYFGRSETWLYARTERCTEIVKLPKKKKTSETSEGELLKRTAAHEA